MAKNIVEGKESRVIIGRGLDKLANAVKVTLGPRGRNVVIERPFGAPVITKDGVTVAREIELEDALENIGAQMVRQVALRMSDVAGDGTTTATVLAQHIYASGMKVLDRESVNPIAVKRGIDAAVESVVGKLVRTGSAPMDATYEGGALNTISIPVEDGMVANIGTISANGDGAIGEMIAQALKEIGEDGVLTVEESHTMESELVVVSGMRFGRGYLSPYFVTNPERMECVLEKPYILITNRAFSSVEDVKRIMEKCAAASRPLFIIAAGVDGLALSILVQNHFYHRSIKCCAIKAPGYGNLQVDALGDIAAVVGGTVLMDAAGNKPFATVELQSLGQADKVIVTADSTTIIEASGENTTVDKRIADIRSLLGNARTQTERTQLQERLAKLSGGIGIIKIGAPTEMEMREKKDRAEDAAYATRAAKQEGIVPGGGVALLLCRDAVSSVVLASLVDSDERLGAEIVLDALESPFRQIVANAGDDEDEKLAGVLERGSNFGYNAKTREYEDMVVAGIIDPTKVTRHALINAASIAGMMLTTEALISEIPAPPPAMPTGMGTRGMV